MNENELKEVVRLAEDFWPKATPSELGLLRKLSMDKPFSRVKKILEKGKLESKYNSLPLNLLKKNITTINTAKKIISYNCVYLGGAPKDTYFTTWPRGRIYTMSHSVPIDINLNDDSTAIRLLEHAKDCIFKEFSVSSELFRIFIENWDGRAATAVAFDLQMEDPEKRRQYADYLDILEASKNRRLAGVVAESLPEIPKEPIVNTQTVAKEMMVALEQEFAPYDPNIDDGIKF